jgi:hypothetical protein
MSSRCVGSGQTRSIRRAAARNALILLEGITVALRFYIVSLLTRHGGAGMGLRWSIRTGGSFIPRVNEVRGGGGWRSMGRASWGLVGGAAEGRLGAGGGVLLLRELVALSVLVARELLVLLENQYLCNVRVNGR